VADETGRVEAAARGVYAAWWEDGDPDESTRWENLADDDPDRVDITKAVARALAAADRFDREHGIARIRLDDDATLAAIADGLRHAGIEIGSVGGQDYRLYVASFVIGALREAAEQ